jgi:hypothetical protein
MNLTKRIPIRSKAIRNAAKGEPCTVCNRNDGTTVFCHLNEGWAGKGMGQKADDLGGGFFGCSTCHADYDGPNTIEEWVVMRAVYRTLRRLWELGIIKVNP